MSLIKEVELQESSLGKEKNQDNNYQKVLITETNGVKEKSNGSNKISRETTDNEFKRNLLFDAKPITIWKLLFINVFLQCEYAKYKLSQLNTYISINKIHTNTKEDGK